MRADTARLFESLLDWFPDIIQSVDAGGHIVYVNRKASELLGYAHDEIIGMHVGQLYAPEIWAKVQTGFSALKTQGTLRVNESLICDKAGNRIPVEIRSFAVYDKDGSFLRTFSILRDIRETKSLQNQVLHSSRLAAIGEISACIAHDITNPLAVIRLYLELMQSQVDELAAGDGAAAKSGVQESLAALQRASGKIAKLILHLREFSRSREAQMEPVDLRGVISDALFMVTNKLDKQNVKVERAIPDSPCLVQGNASQLEQVFMNLFSNACDAMKGAASAPVLRISVAPFAGDADCAEGWECRVADNGPGIPPHIKDQLFQPFFTTKAKGEGTGLGLSITKQVVKRHGGAIAAGPDAGPGATFVLLLPSRGPAPMVGA